MDKKGWVSIDFLAAFLIIILTIPGIMTIAVQRTDTANSVHEITEAKVLTENVAETVEMVYSGGVGCYITYKTPPAISNKPYYMIINSSGVYVIFNGMMGTAFITPMTISNTLKKGRSNVLMQPNKSYNISNIQDEHGYTHIIITRIFN